MTGRKSRRVAAFVAAAFLLGLAAACGEGSDDGDDGDSRACSACYKGCDDSRTSRMLECQLLTDSWTRLACESGAGKTWDACVEGCAQSAGCQ